MELEHLVLSMIIILLRSALTYVLVSHIMSIVCMTYCMCLHDCTIHITVTRCSQNSADAHYLLYGWVYFVVLVCQ